MRNISTMILGAASLILAIVISAVESTESSGTERSHLVRFDEKKVQTLKLERGGQTVVMQKINGYWFFTSPDQDRINNNSMEALLDQLNHLAVLDELDAKELTGDMAPANLGMEGEEALHVVIESDEKGKKKSSHIVIGRAAPRSNAVYAALGDRKNRGVAVVNGNPHDILDSPYETLLERNVVNLPANAITQVAVSTSKSGIVLQRNITQESTSPWILAHPVTANADQEKTEDLLASILSLQISDVKSSASGAVSIPQPLPEGAAVVQFSIYGAEKPIVLYLEELKDKEDDFAPTLLTARISDRPANYIVNSILLDTLDKSLANLRDRRLRNIPEKVLESIAIIGRNPVSEVFLKADRSAKGVNWEVLLNGNSVDANYTKIRALIDKMGEPVIIDFVEGGKPEDYGIDPSAEGAMVVAFNFELPGRQQEDGTVGEPEKISSVLRLGRKDGDVPRLFANFQGESQIYELEPGFAGLIPVHPVKWRSLNVLSFNPFRLEKLRKEVKGQGIVDLEYNNVRAEWKAIRSDGTNVTNSLDRTLAASLRDRLASLKAIGWNLNAGEGFRLLENPDAIFTIVTSELDPAINQPVEKTRVLKLVESKGVVYGRIDDNPDLFFLDREKFKSLIRPLTSFATQ